MIKFEDTASMTGMRVTSDGYLVGEVRCARVGLQTYDSSEIGLPGSGPVSVYRPESAVFSKDSMATFSGKPVTLNHPPVQVTADNWKQYAVGDIGEDIARDGDFIRVPIKLMDADVIRAVKAGTREISMGYTCQLRHEDGVTPDGQRYQAIQDGPIRINHLAVVKAARGGSELRIGDGAEKWGASPVKTVPSRDHQKEAIMPDMQKVIIDGLTIMTTDQGAQAVEKLQRAISDSAKQLADAQSTHDAAIAAKDAELAKLQAKLDDATGKILSDADLDAKVAARAELVSVAKAIAPDVKTEGVKDSDIRKAVVTAKLGDAAIADKSAAYIDARFDILAEDAKPADPVAGAFRQGIKTDDAAINDAHNSYVARLTRKTKEA